MESNIVKNNSSIEVSLKFDDDISINSIVTPPDGEVSFVDILPEIYTIHADIISATIRKNKNDGIVTKCSKGCSTCCRQLITISIHEAILLVYLVDMLNSEERNRIRHSFDEILSKIEQHNFLKDLIYFHIDNFEDKDAIINIQKEYWELQLACPFLVDNSCSIYPYRPLICREYLVSSEPQKCSELFNNNHYVHRVRLTHNFASAAASFDGVEAIKTRAIPLPIIFLIDGLLSYFSRSKTTAERMLTMYFNHTDKHFRI